MEVEDIPTGLGAEDQSFSASHERTYDEKKNWDLNENAEQEDKREGYCDDRIDAELDYDEENRDSDHSSLQGDADHEEGGACLVSDDDLEGDGRHIADGVQRDSGKREEHESFFDIERKGSGTPNAEQKREPSEEGEIDDLEEGELRSDSENGNEQPETAKKVQSLKAQDPTRSVGRRGEEENVEVPNVCKFYLRGNCTWGLDCKYIHPHDNNRDRVACGSRARNPEWSSGDRERDSDRPSIHSRVTYPSSATDKAESSTSHGSLGESAWERGLREARELMKKATKKKEEPDFEKKRLVLAPSEELDRRTTDDDSDDSRLMSKGGVRGDLSPRRNLRISAAGNIAYGDGRSRNVRRYDRFPEQSVNEVPLGGRNGYRNERYTDDYGRTSSGYGPVNRSRIPSLMDGIRENRFIEVKKDLGPQVLYPNGRPGNRRRDNNVRRNNKREMPINERYYVPRRSSRSPHSSSRSPLRSPSPRRGALPVSRSGSEKSGPTKKQHSLGPNISLSGGGINIRDPWDRNQRKRNRSRELPSTTLGAVLQKARLSEERSRSRKRPHSTSMSESSVSESSSSTTSRSTSSDRRRKAATRASLASAIPLKNLFDDDGSIRQTDLSSFRIPKKKRPSRSPSRPTAVLKRSASKTHSIHSEPIPRNEPQTSRPKWQANGSPSRRSQQPEKPIRSFRNNDIIRNERRLSEAKEEISSEESSSSSSSDISTDEDNEPAAYRQKRKSQTEDDGLPTEGIPLSPEAEAEDVSSDENDRSPSAKETASGSPSGSHSTSDHHISPSPVDVENEQREDSGSEHREDDYDEDRCNESEADDYMDDEAEKEERRAELLRQLKCVEEAIARKRHRPVA